MSKTILITGVSSGLGLAMAEAALNAGHIVVGTVREDGARRQFEAKVPGRSFAHCLDVTDTPAVKRMIHTVQVQIGPIDVLINNAGYGLKGVVEEIRIDDLRRQFEVNVFAPVALIQDVLPEMRAQRRGHIINIASMGGVVTFPGLGAYHGSKFALLGLGDALAQELEPLGIQVTSVLPGVYRSDWGGRSLSEADRSITDYDWVFEDRPDVNWGDPVALGRVVLDVIHAEQPPRRLLVGPTAVAMVSQQIQAFSHEIEMWQTLSHAGGEG